jgi:hypothetical protein
MHVCDQCEYKTMHKFCMTRHVKLKHTNAEKAHRCQQCEYSTHLKQNLHKHVQIQHSGSAALLRCPHCEYSTKFEVSMQRHVKMVHLRQRSECPVCHKSVANLNSHMYQRHKGLSFPCPHCPYIGSTTSSLRKHMANMHNVGDHTCDICLRTRTSVVRHDNNDVCRACYRKITGANTRVEKRCVDFLMQRLDGLLSADTSLGGCSRYRPDMLWVSPRLLTLVEVDEHQHNLRGGNYTCEERRLSDICVELLQSFPQHQVAVIRWNPHTCKGHSANVSERLEALLLLMRALRAQPPECLTVYYMWYDRNNPHLVENIPRQLLYGPPPPHNFVR